MHTTFTIKSILAVIFVVAITFLLHSQAPQSVVEKYRYQQPYLFQTVPSYYIHNRINGGYDFVLDRYGPTRNVIDYYSGWVWQHPYGDYLDSNLVSQGSKPWFTVTTQLNLGSTYVKMYETDVTSAISYIFKNNKWNAFKLVELGDAPRTIATPFDTVNAPRIIVTYTNNEIDTLECRIVAFLSAAESPTPYTADSKCNFPAFIEFDRPDSDVKSATLQLTVVAHWSGWNGNIGGFLLDPHINMNPVEQGVAANAGLLDLDIKSQPGVIGTHRYVDGTSWSDFTYSGIYQNIGAEYSFDPAIYGTGPQDKSKLPHIAGDRWVNLNPEWSLVSSAYSGEGFEPLAPGLGALRIRMDKYPGIKDSAVIDNSGTGTVSYLFLPDSMNGKPMFGDLDHIFIRYYFRLGSPYHITTADRLETYRDYLGGPVFWANLDGKWGIVPDHSTTYGGVSGTSGGGYGWQMRMAWCDVDAGMGGPSEGGWPVGYHLYDFQYNNPPGHQYGYYDANNPIPGLAEQWKNCGLNILYADKWYCIEMEMKLNTITEAAPGYLEDGLLRTWIDGRLAWESSGMVFRTKPLEFPFNPEYIRPARSLGVRNLQLNWFHGGQTENTVDRTTFYTGLVWGTEYIGPMNTGTVSGVSKYAEGSDFISIYPNPNKGAFNFELKNKQNTPVNIAIYNINGMKVSSKKLDAGVTNATFNLVELPAGVYTLKAAIEKSTVIKKIIVQ